MLLSFVFSLIMWARRFYGCHTQAKTLDKVMERIKEAIQACLETEGQKSSGRTELVGIQFVEVHA
jgi:predicted RNase H-like HicB family nuclease